MVAQLEPSDGPESEASRYLRSLSRPELISLLEILAQDIESLQRYLRRAAVQQRRSQIEPGAPSEYESFSEYLHESAVDIGLLPGRWDKLVRLYISMGRHRSQLEATVARRSGDPFDNGYQNRDQWARWYAAKPLPRAISWERDEARRLSEEGETYQSALWVIANMKLMWLGHSLTRADATALIKAVDRGYGIQVARDRPMILRGWWKGRTTTHFRPLPGGRISLGLEWNPREYLLPPICGERSHDGSVTEP